MENIVIIGGGFAGTAAAKKLAGKLPEGHQLVIVSDSEFFTFKPLLHEAATGAFGQEVVCESIKGSFDRADFVKGRATKIDTARKVIEVEGHGRLRYSYALLALGSQTNFYGVPGAEKNAFKLERAEDATAIRGKVAGLLTKGKTAEMIIAGAGPTGTETAAELSEFAQQLAKERKAGFRITLIDRSEAILPGVSQRFRNKVLQLMEREKVRLLTGKAVAEVGKGHVRLGSGERLRSGLTIWAAGIKPSEISITPKVEMKKGGIAVNDYLLLPGSGNAFAAGDCAAVSDLGGGFVPWLAQAAVQEGSLAAENILAAMKGRPMRKFRFRNKGFALPVGKGRAVADIRLAGMRLFFDGFPAWWLNRTAYLMHMLTLRHKAKVAWLWAIGLFAKRKA